MLSRATSNCFSYSTITIIFTAELDYLTVVHPKQQLSLSFVDRTTIKEGGIVDNQDNDNFVDFSLLFGFTSGIELLWS